MKGFKEFLLRGNIIDLAVGVIVGSAFGKIVDSLVKDIIMPPIGILLGKVDFSNLFIVLMHGKTETDYVSLVEAQKDGAITLNIGLFLNTVISFFIISVCIYLLISIINKLKSLDNLKQKVIEEQTTKVCKYCCSTINIKAVKCPNCTADLNNI